MHVLSFAASLRRNSLNRRLVEVASRIAEAEGARVERADFRDFTMPMYDGDVEAGQGLPPGAVALVERVRSADAILVASPEYNFSIAGTFKNAIDWSSRSRPMPWRGKSVYLMAASPSPMGGIRGLWHARVPLEGCGALVFPDMFALAHADQAFDEAGELRDPKVYERLHTELAGFLRLAQAVSTVCGGRVPRDGEAGRRKIDEALEEQSALQPVKASG